jgi:hypothetical protein
MTRIARTIPTQPIITVGEELWEELVLLVRVEWIYWIVKFVEEDLKKS